MLMPTGDRVLIRPDDQPEQTDSGLVLLQDRHVPDVTGVVVQVGHGSAAARRVRASTVAHCVKRATAAGASPEVLAALTAYAAQVDAPSDVSVGDHVVFSYSAGQEVTEDGVRYVLLQTDAVLAVWQEDAA